jgi:predicted RNase H-like HicB family nuclease
MEYRLGVEDMEPGRWIAWVFDLPGCYSGGQSRDQAIESAPAAIEEMLLRLDRAGYGISREVTAITAVVAEEFRSFPHSPDYLVNAYFENDDVPLTDDDVAYGRHVLKMNRGELSVVTDGLAEDILLRTIPGEVQTNLRGILNHIGTAEWWYWDRLGMIFPREKRPRETRELLAVIRDFTMTHLSDLMGSDLKTVRSGETWSPRKLLRRAIWHERAHTVQIIRYLDETSNHG